MKVRWHPSTHDWLVSLSVAALEAVEDHLEAIGRDPMIRSLGEVGSRDRYTRFLLKHIAFRVTHDGDVERGALLVVMVKDAPRPKYLSGRKILPFKRL